VVAEAAVDMGPEWRTFNKEKRVRTAPLRLGCQDGYGGKSGAWGKMAQAGEVPQRDTAWPGEEAG
jgi:transcription initiation factor TFIIIB Brf1 subunit/transcription initiation factor TFIIB